MMEQLSSIFVCLMQPCNLRQIQNLPDDHECDPHRRTHQCSSYTHHPPMSSSTIQKTSKIWGKQKYIADGGAYAGRSGCLTPAPPPPPQLDPKPCLGLSESLVMDDGYPYSESGKCQAWHGGKVSEAPPPPPCVRHWAEWIAWSNFDVIINWQSRSMSLYVFFFDD